MGGKTGGEAAAKETCYEKILKEVQEKDGDNRPEGGRDKRQRSQVKKR